MTRLLRSLLRASRSFLRASRSFLRELRSFSTSRVLLLVTRGLRRASKRKRSFVVSKTDDRIERHTDGLLKNEQKTNLAVFKTSFCVRPLPIPPINIVRNELPKSFIRKRLDIEEMRSDKMRSSVVHATACIKGVDPKTSKV